MPNTLDTTLENYGKMPITSERWVPEGKKLYPFQIEGVKILIKRKHNLLADTMGLGKTNQAIALINALKLRRVLIVCPATIKRNWASKLQEWLTSARVIQIIDKKTDFVTDLTEVVIVNYDIISHSYMLTQLTNIKWDLLICDEAHRLKNMDAKRTISVLSKEGLVRCAERTLMMTGTPILNRPVELYPILRVLAPQVIAPYSDYWKFAKRYCDAYSDGFSFNVKGASNTDELNKKLREHYMTRRCTHEVEVQLPKKRYEMVFIDTSDGIRTKFRTLESASRKDFQYQTIDSNVGELATIRRETAEEKVKLYIETIKEYVESTNKLVIFAYHRSVIRLLEATFEASKTGYVSLTGETSQIRRQSSIESFRRDPQIKVFIGQVDAAGEGIDGLQAVCNNVLFLEWSWSPGAIEQACKRVHRIGQTKPVLIRFLVWADTVEEHQMRTVLDKVKVIREVLK